VKNVDRLYELLPFVYRQRDVDQGYPLRALLRVIAEQVEVVEDDIAQLYENWFVETCQDWVVPYIGALVGYRPVHEAGEPGDPRLARDRERNKILTPRREVANIIGYRRRKGTLALLELLANNVAGWPARPLEFYRLLNWMQNLNFQHLQHGCTASLCNGDALDRIGGAFDELAHTVDVRRTISRRTSGRYNVPSAELFLWRLNAYRVTETIACCVEDVGPHCYSFSVLGNDNPLYTFAQAESEPTHIAEELNLPSPIRRRAFEKRILKEGRLDHTEASTNYYDPTKSLAIWAKDWPQKGADLIPPDAIVPADLRGWRYHAARDHVAVDPVTGRIVFPAGQLPRQGVVVTYNYGFSADMGGGEYERRLSQPAEARIYRVDKKNRIQDALNQWAQASPKPRAAVIELTESGVYTEPLDIQLGADESLQIRAANKKRPVIRLLDYLADRPDAFKVSGGKGSRLTLDGLLITGRGVQISGPEAGDNKPPAQPDMCSVIIRHCTLVPGWGLQCDCKPKRSSEPSLILVNTSAHLKIEHSIIGAIEVTADVDSTDPLCVEISDSIWDATSEQQEALSGVDGEMAYTRLKVVRSTIIGQVLSHEMVLAENSIFQSHIEVARRQVGCVRFCYVPHGSRTPRRYECQPDLVVKAVDENLTAGEDRNSAEEQEQFRVKPAFNSVRYGTPTYCQLAESCAKEITHGSEDEAEMGAFHDLYQPQRIANLRARLDEYTPAGMDVGICNAT
jgi:hypothetical protein